MELGIQHWVDNNGPSVHDQSLAIDWIFQNKSASVHDNAAVWCVTGEATSCVHLGVQKYNLVVNNDWSLAGVKQLNSRWSHNELPSNLVNLDATLVVKLGLKHQGLIVVETGPALVINKGVH